MAQPMPSRGHGGYRADIDGLRAAAVAAVLLFHGFPALLGGGFVGVDVFFVISGYLITGILLDGLDRGRLDLIGFYRRRVRRIFPALLVVLAACFAAGWLVLFADEFARLGKHIAAGAGFVANFALWREAGYFDIDAAAKPLLHLWSLAIEEQFYLAWPLLLWLARRARIAPLWLAAACTLASFALCVWLAPRDPVADFYLPLARFWEILLGAMLVCAERSGAARLPPGWRTPLSLLGGAAILAAALLLRGTDSFPGWRAAFPVLGAAMVLAAGPSAWVNRRLLSARPMVWAGLISYPLYLWHWPLLAFARIVAGAEPAAAERAALLAASVVLATITCLALERPLRFGRHGGVKAAALCALMLAVAYAGVNDWQRGGLRFRAVVKDAPLTGVAAIGNSSPFVSGCALAGSGRWLGFCMTDTREPPRYAIWGDSHAEALFWGLTRVSQPGRRWVLVGRHTCAPMAGMQRLTHNQLPAAPATDPAECAAANEAALRFVLSADSVRVVLIATARRVLERESYAQQPGGPPQAQGAAEGIGALVDMLERAGKRVVFLHDNPFVAEPANCAARRTGIAALDAVLPARRDAACTLAYDAYAATLAPYRRLIAALQAAHPALTVFDPTPLLCDVAANRCPMTQNGDFLYSYSDHVSSHGAARIATGLLPVMDALAAAP